MKTQINDLRLELNEIDSEKSIKELKFRKELIDLIILRMPNYDNDNEILLNALFNVIALNIINISQTKDELKELCLTSSIFISKTALNWFESKKEKENENERN